MRSILSRSISCSRTIQKIAILVGAGDLWPTMPVSYAKVMFWEKEKKRTFFVGLLILVFYEDHRAFLSFPLFVVWGV